MSGECLYAIHGPRATGTCGCETCYFDYKHKLEEEEDTGGAAPMTWVAMIRETMEQVVPPAEMRAAARAAVAREMAAAKARAAAAEAAAVVADDVHPP
jgi:hypothetical protein